MSQRMEQRRLVEQRQLVEQRRPVEQRDLVARPGVVRESVATLLRAACRGLIDADMAVSAGQRYADAHLAALRGAAAVLAARARPAAPTGRGRPTSAWVLLSAVAPELAEWADFFALGAAKRSAAETGQREAVSQREADDLLRDAHTFVALVEGLLEAGGQLPLGMLGGSGRRLDAPEARRVG